MVLISGGSLGVWFWLDWVDFENCKYSGMVEMNDRIILVERWEFYIYIRLLIVQLSFPSYYVSI